MIEWRVGRGWSRSELKTRLEELRCTERSFTDSPGQMNRANGWHEYSSEAVIAHEASGTVREGRVFERAKLAVTNYQFSDPRIVVGHFDPEAPLLGRLMLLEMRAFRILHYLGGVVVGAVRSTVEDGQTIFGFRYDTLEGHIEHGTEWFLLTKNHENGAIRFRIEAAWRPGSFPNRLSRLGFSIFGSYYQETWHRRAHRRLAELVREPEPSSKESDATRPIQSHPEITFTRQRGYDV